jgi:hypothetical protein
MLSLPPIIRYFRAAARTFTAAYNAAFMQQQLLHPQRCLREELEDQALSASDVDEERRKHQGLHCHQLHQNVQGGAAGVLQGVTHGVTNDGSLVAVAALATKLASVLGSTSLQGISGAS